MELDLSREDETFRHEVRWSGVYKSGDAAELEAALQYANVAEATAATTAAIRFC